ncbi:uncharacterized protein LOC114459441 isoform X2 [Gouania willdenowi]|nr:uncharacterized protein LOC114459441 isoform X2 [Gouania willdenowi]
MRRDPTGGSKDSTDHAHNKQCFREYVELFPSGNIAVAMKEEQYVEKKSQQTVTTQQSSIQSKGSQPSPKKCSSVASLSSLLVRKGEQNLTKMMKRLVSPMKVRPSLTHARTQPSSTISSPTASTPPASVPSSSFVEETPSTSAVPGPSSAPGRSSSAPGKPVSEPDDITLLAEVLRWEEAQTTTQRVCLPAGWIKTLPEVDQKWMSKALFKWTAQGHPELDFNRVDKLWWYPPQVPLQAKNVPRLENYFSHPLFLWMPRKLWQVKLMCPHSDCHKELLYSAGLHQKIRQVVSLGTIYFMASEYLACNRCKRKVISWSHGIISQLDVGHRMQFPSILTSKLACDMEVVSLMPGKQQQSDSEEAAGASL